MKIKILLFTLTFLLLGACASIPNETMQLSRLMGKDLVILHNAHRSMVELYYDKIVYDINLFIDETYSPFVIHYVLKIELNKYQNGEESIYGTIEQAGKTGGKAETDNALRIMSEFVGDARKQIEKKRNELLYPIISQRREIISSINKSYENLIYANSTITGYLESIKKVKESQQEALNLLGLQGKDEELNEALLQISEMVNSAVQKGKEIDIKSEDALEKIEDVMNQLKKITKQ